jgi:hypothetical protein
MSKPLQPRRSAQPLERRCAGRSAGSRSYHLSREEPYDRASVGVCCDRPLLACYESIFSSTAELHVLGTSIRGVLPDVPSGTLGFLAVFGLMACEQAAPSWEAARDWAIHLHLGCYRSMRSPYFEFRIYILCVDTGRARGNDIGSLRTQHCRSRTI